MDDHAVPEMTRRLTNQYARMLRLSVAECAYAPAERMLLRRGILARYLSLVDLGRGDEADRMLAWRDAERRAWRENNGLAA